MLRKELQPKEPGREKRLEIRKMLSKLHAALEKGPLTKKQQDTFREVTGFQASAESFIGDISARHLDGLAEELAFGPPPVVPDITREELVEIVELVFANLNNSGLMTWYCKCFDRNVPMPKASDLVFFPPAEMAVQTIDYEPDPEEIVDRALNYKPLSLS